MTVSPLPECVSLQSATFSRTCSMFTIPNRTQTLCLLILFAASVTFCGSCGAQDMPLSQVIVNDEPWRLVADGLKFTEAPAVDAHGRLYFSDVPSGRIFRLNDSGAPRLFAENDGKTSGLMFGPSGLLFACHYKTKQVVAYEQDATFNVVATLPPVNDLVVSHDGHVFVTDPASQAVWHIKYGDGSKPRKVAEGFKPNGIILWHDEQTLVVTDGDSSVLRTFRVESDGSLKFGDRYYSPLQKAFNQPTPQSDGMTVDDDGRLYVATNVGVQMFDPTGRLGGSISRPQNAFLSNVVFGGGDFRTLYATSADKVYARRVKPSGTPASVRFAEKP